MSKTSSRRNNMKKLHIISSSILVSLLLGSALLLNNKIDIKEAKADTTTDMDSISPESGEQLDTANMIYDDFSSGINTGRWVVSKKAWGNGTVSYNSGVIPENVFYNSEDKTVVFRALGDYYKDNDVNYDLHSKYGYAHDDSTGGGRVYSKDGTRTGGCIKTREEFGPGRFEAKFKVAPVEGVCTAFWTFNYGEGGETNYNEMDFELPTYLDSDNKDDLYFNRIICTTYKEEEQYKSQRVTNPVYLNDNQYHTYCLEWYYSNNTKKVKWFIDGSLICSWNNTDHISNNIGRVTLGTWIPGRSSFCGIPNFDKAYMELDYFKYTPFKNQTNVSVSKTLADYSTTYTTITETPQNDFAVQGRFNYGITDNFLTSGDVSASKSYNYEGGNSSYGVKIAGAGHSGTSWLKVTQPNIRGISKLNLSMNYKGSGWIEGYADGDYFYCSEALNQSSWSSFNQDINIPNLAKQLVFVIYSEDSANGLTIDNVSLQYPEQQNENPDPSGLSSYSFFTKTNGQTSDSTSNEKDLYPDGVSTHLWKVGCGKYYIKNNDVNTIYVKPNTNVMNADSSSYYYPFKTCLANNGFSSGNKVALFAMQFDVDNFKDVELAMYSYSGVSGRTIYILYSLDSGLSWSLLDSKACSSSNMPGDGTTFRYNYRFVAPNSLQGKTIRLAFAGSDGGSEDGYRIMSVFINNYENFKEKLDGPTCSLSKDDQDFLAHEYDNLTDNEKTLLANETMTNYNQSYFAGYSYLVNYWNHSGSNSRLIIPVKENAIILFAFIVTGVGVVITFFLITRKKKKINR